MSDLRALIEAAKADAPSAAAKAKVWAGVSSAVGGPASMSGGGAAGSVGAVKMLMLGTLLGGAVTVGIGAAMLVVGGARPVEGTTGVAAPAPATAPPPAERLSLSGASPAACSTGILGSTVNPSPVAIASPVIASPAPVVEARRPGAARSASALTQTATSGLPPLPPRTGQDDALAREASLLASARNALARHDALTALQIVRGLSALPTRQLVPEELAVEAQALRGLGLADQAEAVDATLRAQFPDSVLGR
jgi:hypothetical protein